MERSPEAQPCKLPSERLRDIFCFSDLKVVGGSLTLALESCAIWRLKISKCGNEIKTDLQTKKKIQRTEKTPLYVHIGQVIFDRSAKTIQWGEDRL